MESSSSFLSIPWWIWFTLGMIVAGIVVVCVLKYESEDNQAHRPFRESRRGRRHRERSKSHRHRRRGDKGDDDLKLP